MKIPEHRTHTQIDTRIYLSIYYRYSIMLKQRFFEILFRRETINQEKNTRARKKKKKTSTLGKCTRAFSPPLSLNTAMLMTFTQSGTKKIFHLYQRSMRKTRERATGSTSSPTMENSVDMRYLYLKKNSHKKYKQEARKHTMLGQET